MIDVLYALGTGITVFDFGPKWFENLFSSIFLFVAPIFCFEMQRNRNRAFPLSLICQRQEIKPRWIKDKKLGLSEWNFSSHDWFCFTFPAKGSPPQAPVQFFNIIKWPWIFDCENCRPTRAAPHPTKCLVSLQGSLNEQNVLKEFNRGPFVQPLKQTDRLKDRHTFWITGPIREIFCLIFYAWGWEASNPTKFLPFDFLRLNFINLKLGAFCFRVIKLASSPSTKLNS